MNKKIIFATGNIDKMKEIREILADTEFDIVSMKEAGIVMNIKETGQSFAENAMIKARAVADVCDSIVLADDSGLEIDYLNKEPGIYSARYMGEDTSYHIKNTSLLNRLEGVLPEDRTARFVCAIAAVFPEGDSIITQGIMEGRIGYAEQGENGFGYDPIFCLPPYHCSTAQLSRQQKNAASHRGQALRKMRIELLTRNQHTEEK
ncbi:MAG: RdgB/HAM1 family non-canonical purine NTP pyrophosphatase [Lachnospiraceae bacterium]